MITRWRVMFNPPRRSDFFKVHPTANPNKYPVKFRDGFTTIKDATNEMKKVNGTTPGWYYVEEYIPSG